MSTKSVSELLSEIIHPESGTSIIGLNIVQNIKEEEDKLSLNLVFKPNDPFGNSIKKQVQELLERNYPNKQIKILELRREAPKPKPEISDFGISKVKHIIAISSGKGGVGKSTTSANLAVALAKMGYKVGLIDADLYGPSIPKMFGIEDAKPMMVERDGHELIEPVEKYGVKILSIGFFISPNDPIIWRGPVATSAIRQLTKQSDWNDTEYLLIDLPPGTGDIHITMLQEIKLSSAIVVTTPQAVAVADVLKGINMYRMEHVSVPIVGIIENMAWFTPAELPNNKYYIFGKDGGKRLAKELNLELLGQVPLIQSVCESGDKGEPIVLHQTVAGELFREIAEKLVHKLNEQ